MGRIPEILSRSGAWVRQMFSGNNDGSREQQSTGRDGEAELQEAIAARKQAVEQFESFLYIVSHDLRAPLRAIKGFTTALREDYGHLYDEEGKDYANRIVAAGERMEAMINGLLLYSRAGRGETTTVRIELQELLGRLRQRWAPLFEARGATLEIGESLPAVKGNPGLLEQALTQLIENAIKFVAPGKVPRVQIKAVQVGNRVRLNVIDNGIGIEAKNFSKLFQVFQRFNPEGEYAGQGIGLAIVRKVAEKMGGSAGADSQPQVGSCFWLELPAD